MLIAVILGGLAVLSLVLMMAWRVVVPTDHVHIVQRRKTSTAYGHGYTEAGNVYFNIPAFVPYFGVTVAIMPTAIFSVSVDKYDAYDKARVPFLVDVMSFFQIEDAVEASKRVKSLDELRSQLQNTVRAAVRRVLSGFPIDEIMGSRSTLNKEFIGEISEQTKNWGVRVNSVEFMSIEDFPGTRVVTNIMDKERTTIEMESRKKVAENMQAAELAEIQARQVVDLRAVEKNRTVSLESQKAAQTVNEEAAKTKLTEANVKSVETIRAQEIEKNRQEVAADMAAAVLNKDAVGRATAMRTEAEGFKNAKVLEGEGEASKVKSVGTAEANVVEATGLAEAMAKLKMAEALAKYNDAGMSIEKLKALIEIETAKYTALGQGFNKADVKIVQSGEGSSLLGIPLNAKSGADIDVFLKELGIGSVGEAVAKLKAAVTK